MPTNSIVAIPRASNPFDTTGVHRDERGIAYYAGLPTSLPALLRQRATDSADVEAVVELGGQRLTYRELADRARRIAGGLRAGGLSPGERVALRYPAGVNWVLAFWGVLFAGGVPVAVNTRFTASEVAFVLDDAGVSVDLDEGTPLPDGEPFDSLDPRGDDIAGLFYTSGTVGRPKGVPTTHAAFLSNAESMIRCAGIPADSGARLRTLISVPLFHVTGCNSQLLLAAHIGGTAVVMPALDRGLLLRSLAEERISFLVTVPAVYALLINDPAFAAADVSTVGWVGYGGAPIAPSLVHKLRAAFPEAKLCNGFGLTESASLLTVLPNEEVAEHADSVGYATPVVDLAIDPIDDANHGELLARGPNVTRGYWNRDNADTFVDGWLRTGDIVRVDDAGRVAIVDRAKDLINRGGENVSSVEVESALADAPGVAEAAVLGVPDEVMGEKVGAVLVAAEGELDTAAIVAHVAARLAEFKVPQYLTVSGTPLPRNAAGKILKARLRDDVTWGDPLR
ncbi:acyl-CoA synthetase (AMP-forming)/AMP-acid ligase II [Tamaricihabitans halophyticus]|uniref:Acyl-CoA synthetase (AMP-forming)/AMP-acid ligase II n=1 Tax=Tamaricihabitans halophyticus TaxID=1262583 RepID=A0A4R2QQI5_9PSEU|nr:AMP-binding protein [Tamaricihabitans halophyticus]TCP52003.1 acyl-CoA synthetase (AMP-forming)/AMP-acid ligase II [Tamaricihabitans halophyticus]